MGNKEQKNVKRKLDELKRITGLSFHMDLPDTEGLSDSEAEEVPPTCCISLTP